MFFTRFNSAENPVIELIKKAFLFLTLGYTFLFSLFQNGLIAYDPSSLFIWQTTSFLEYLLKTWVISFVIPYTEFSWDMLWDFALLQTFYLPIVSFTLSYLGIKSFFQMWFLFAYVAGGSMMLFSRFFPAGIYPSSLFISIAYGITLFWTLMMRTSGSKPNALIIIPISLEWIIALSTLLCIIIPITQGKVAIGLSSCVVGFTAYLYGIIQWRMSSNVPKLLFFEEKAREQYYEIEKFIQWHLLRRLRNFFSKK